MLIKSVTCTVPRSNIRHLPPVAGPGGRPISVGGVIAGPVSACDFRQNFDFSKELQWQICKFSYSAVPPSSPPSPDSKWSGYFISAGDFGHPFLPDPMERPARYRSGWFYLRTQGDSQVAGPDITISANSIAVVLIDANAGQRDRILAGCFMYSIPSPNETY
jgi:hypothetical protein